MIFKYAQVDTSPNEQHLICNGEVVGIGSTERFFHGILQIGDISYELTTTEDGRILIKENGVEIGEIKEKSISLDNKKFFGKSIIYFEFKIHDRCFEIYHITFLKRDHNFRQIMENGKVVAILQKKDRVDNHNDTYTGYIEDESMLHYAALWCFWLHSSKYFPFMIVGEGNVSKRRVSFSAKHVREIYDPTFIERVLQMEQKGNER